MTLTQKVSIKVHQLFTRNKTLTYLLKQVLLGYQEFFVWSHEAYSKEGDETTHKCTVPTHTPALMHLL